MLRTILLPSARSKEQGARSKTIYDGTQHYWAKLIEIAPLAGAIRDGLPLPVTAHLNPVTPTADLLATVTYSNSV